MCLIHNADISYLICARFTKKFAAQHPRNFAKDILVDKIGAKEVIVGYDYKFGRGGEGTIDYLHKMGKEFGFSVTIIEPLKIDVGIVSSSAIRDLLENGEVVKAAQRLGRLYSVEGKVVPGFDMGSGLGYPTANLKTPSELIPKTGVYAVNATINDCEKHEGVVNVGFNPTFHRDNLTIETHLFNFKNILYGKKMEVFFVKRIRDEVEFKSARELSLQIRNDVKVAKEILRNTEVHK